MNERETIQGKPVSEKQILEWSEQAASGFDIAVLKKRGRGRPGRGAGASQVIALRLTDAELIHLDEIATRSAKTRSEILREALEAYSSN